MCSPNVHAHLPGPINQDSCSRPLRVVDPFSPGFGSRQAGEEDGRANDFEWFFFSGFLEPFALGFMHSRERMKNHMSRCDFRVGFFFYGVVLGIRSRVIALLCCITLRRVCDWMRASSSKLPKDLSHGRIWCVHIFWGLWKIYGQRMFGLMRSDFWSFLRFWLVFQTSSLSRNVVRTSNKKYAAVYSTSHKCLQLQNLSLLCFTKKKIFQRCWLSFEECFRQKIAESAALSKNLAITFAKNEGAQVGHTSLKVIPLSHVIDPGDVTHLSRESPLFRQFNEATPPSIISRM